MARNARAGHPALRPHRGRRLGDAIRVREKAMRTELRPDSEAGIRNAEPRLVAGFDCDCS